MTAPKRTRIQREADYVEIARRYLRGESQAAIAAVLNVSQQQVSNDLKRIQQRWAERYTDDINRHKFEELARINHLEQTYWQAWERSLEKRTVKSAEESPDGKRKKGLCEEGRDGNPAYLTGVQWCIERRCKILGIDAPEKKEWSGPNGQPMRVELDAREKLLGRLAELAARAAEGCADPGDAEGAGGEPAV